MLNNKEEILLYVLEYSHDCIKASKVLHAGLYNPQPCRLLTEYFTLQELDQIAAGENRHFQSYFGNRSFLDYNTANEVILTIRLLSDSVISQITYWL